MLNSLKHIFFKSGYIRTHTILSLNRSFLRLCKTFFNYLIPLHDSSINFILTHLIMFWIPGENAKLPGGIDLQLTKWYSEFQARMPSFQEALTCKLLSVSLLIKGRLSTEPEVDMEQAVSGKITESLVLSTWLPG